MAGGAELAKEILKSNRRAILDFVQAKGASQTRDMLVDCERDLITRLAQAEGLSGPGKGSFTAAQLRVALAQVRDVLKSRALPGLKKAVLGTGQAAAEQGSRHVAAYIAEADKSFRGVGAQPLALDAALMLERSQKGVEGSILRRLVMGPNEARGGILKRYGMDTITEFEKQLQKGLIAKKSWAEMRADITASSTFLQGAPAHWAARIVRTEAMGAYNRASWESVREADEQLGDMVKILSATFDERTGSDSIAVHGQIRRPDEAFEWWDGLYQHPPNRPNDREIVVPHRIAWPIPKYLEPKDDAAVLARWKAEGRKGSPPPRPKMWTVDPKSFGKRKAKPPEPKPEEKEKPPPEPEKTPREKFAHSMLEATDHAQITKDGGKAAREALQSHLAAEGFKSYDVARKKAMAGVMSVEKDNSKMAGALAWHNTHTGEMRVRASVLDNAHEALTAIKEGKPVAGHHADDLGTLIHEELHGCSPNEPTGYRGVGVAVEEAGTEMLARRQLRALTNDPKVSQAPRFHGEIGNGKERATFLIGGASHAYNGYIKGIMHAVAVATESTEVATMIEDAFVEIRANPSRAWLGPEDQLDDLLFSKALGLTAEQRIVVRDLVRGGILTRYE